MTIALRSDFVPNGPFPSDADLASDLDTALDRVLGDLSGAERAEACDELGRLLSCVLDSTQRPPLTHLQQRVVEGFRHALLRGAARGAGARRRPAWS